jgi:FixJ family two-component response regulator
MFMNNRWPTALAKGSTGDAHPPHGMNPAETVYVIDADHAARHSLCLLLRVSGLRSQAFASANEFLAAVGPTAWGCVVADPGARAAEGLTLIRALKAHNPRLPVIIVTGSGSIALAVATLRAGAVDVLEKPFDSDELLRSLFRALDAGAARQRRGGAAADHRSARLIARESQVFELAARGASDAATARELGLSPRTVEVHRASLMAKLDLSTSAELAEAWRERLAAA